MNLYQKYKQFTMIQEQDYLNNVEICKYYKHIPGCIVECGVWRGGMIAGISEALGADRQYYLFDSFEGLPPAEKKKDGLGAIAWQENTTSPTYYDNCSADIRFAQKAMKISGVPNVKFVKGWYENTLPGFNEPIAILRVDCDWYSSVLSCFENLYEKVVDGGLIIIDDYYVWDGATRAVHDYLSKNDLNVRIRNYGASDLAYIVKTKTYKE